MDAFTCYVCGCQEYTRLPGQARDNDNIVPLKCNTCGHVTLSSLEASNEQAFVSGSWKAVSNISPQLLNEQIYSDSARQYIDLHNLIHSRRVLDFGSGSGAFLTLAKATAKSVIGVDLERQYVSAYDTLGIPLYDKLEALPDSSRFDLITSFHVLGHIADPLPVLCGLRDRLDEGGMLVIETPNADDALLSLYHCEDFAKFTYFTSHVYLYTATSLRILLEKAQFTVTSLIGRQRYPLSNHLYWLSKGLPGGQNHFSRLNDPILNLAYARKLADEGVSDTLIAICETKPMTFGKTKGKQS